MAENQSHRVVSIRESKAKRKRNRIRTLKAFLAAGTMALVIFLIATAVATASSLANQWIVLPQLNEKGFERIPQRTKIFAADGRLLSVFYHENRESVKLAKVPKYVLAATIAIEDQRFYRHNGVDVRSIFRALLSNLKSGRIVEGGSTITQQLVKNIFLSNERTIDRKFREAVLAYQLENKYSKDKIMELYLNTVYYGNGAYGIKAAAELFFNKQPKDLSLEETALLAGLPKAPSRFSPYLNPMEAKARRDKVLRRMAKMHMISEIELDLALAKELSLQPPQTRSKVAAYFVEFVRKTLQEKYGSRMVYRGGLNVHTTIDLKMQEAAENAISGTLNRPDDPSAALVAIDPKTGFIKTAVGGRDFDADQFDLAIQGRRQAGSSFKTFVLVTALAKGMSPETVFSGASPISIRLGAGQNWSVKNFGNSSMGALTMREATVKSVNTVYAQLIMRVGAGSVSRMANRMGINSPVDSLPAIALGGLSRGISPLDMASAYGTLANEGKHVPATPIAKITKTTGEVLFEATPKETAVIDKNVAATANSILQDVVSRGTGKRAALGRPVAGKTGTSENLTDAWFIGYTPQMATSVWVGYPKSKRPMDSVHGISVVGGSFPAEIWHKFMSVAMADYPALGFAGPENNSPVMVCPDMPFQATAVCGHGQQVSAKEAQAMNKTAPCPVHKAPPQTRRYQRPAPPVQAPLPAPAPPVAPEQPNIPLPLPGPQPQPEPEPAPQPQPQPEPEPAPQPQPRPEPEPAPQPQPVPQPQPEPQPPPG